MTRPPQFMVGHTFTFTSAEEDEIASLLRRAQRALWTQGDGYRRVTIECVTAVNRIIHGALNRAHGVESGILAPPMPVIPPTFVD